MADITAKQKMFADEYIKTGNAMESYQLIYKVKATVAKAAASRMLTNVNLAKYIEEVNKKLEKSTIADMTEIKEFWSSLLRDKIADPKDRLKASEYIAKTNGAFIDKLDANNMNNNTSVIVQAKVDLTKLSNGELDNLEKLINKTTND